jgi:tetratricopeptide (TPR) repeat protein
VPTTSLRDAMHHVESEVAARRWSEAARACDQLLAVQPRWLEAQRLKAVCCIMLDRLPEAEKLLDFVLACHPELAQAFIDRANLAQRKGDMVGALACYRRACELNPVNDQLRIIHNQIAAQMRRAPYTPSHTGLARLYMRAELFPQAVREWDISLRANPHRLDAQIGMAETLWRMGDAERSKDICHFILQHMPTCLKPLLLLSLFELDAGNEAEAHRLVDTAGALDPGQRVAATLFSDLTAAGHDALAQLFRESAHVLTKPLNTSELANISQPLIGSVSQPITGSISQPTAGKISQPGMRSNGNRRPITTPLPTGALESGPLFPGARGTTRSDLNEPPPSTSSSEQASDMEDFFSRSRASVMPPEFGKLFKETAYMIWSRDNDEPVTAEIAAMMPGGSHGPSTPSVNDDELAFVRWLQSQGARPIDTAGNMPAASAVALPSSNSSQSSPIELPPFLRQAFAEATDNGPVAGTTGDLQPEASPDLVDGHLQQPVLSQEPGPVVEQPPLTMMPDVPDMPTEQTPIIFMPQPSSVESASESAVSQLHEDYNKEELSDRASYSPDGEPAMYEAPSYTDEAVFIENEQQSFVPLPSYEPVTSYEPEFVDISSVAEAPKPYLASSTIDELATAELDAVHLPSVAEPNISVAVPPASLVESVSYPELTDEEPAAPPLPPIGAAPLRQEMPTLTTPPTIEAIEQGIQSAGFTHHSTGRLSSLAEDEDIESDVVTDIPSRLAHAHDLRRQGRMGEALSEYRQLVKSATDEMPMIIRALRDATLEDPDESELYRLLGDAFIRAGDYIEALEAYNRGSATR